MTILILKTHVTRVYTSYFTEILEISFLVNLGALSSTLCYLKRSDSTADISCKAVTASISISFVTFLGILLYHGLLQIRKSKYCTSFQRAVPYKLLNNIIPQQFATSNSTELKKDSPTVSTVALREQLLESTN